MKSSADWILDQPDTPYGSDPCIGRLGEIGENGPALWLGSLGALVLLRFSPQAAFGVLAAAVAFELYRFFHARHLPIRRSLVVKIALLLAAIFIAERLALQHIDGAARFSRQLDASVRAIFVHDRIWTWLTAQCLHVNTAHLVFNLSAFLVIGPRLECLVGRHHLLGIIAAAAALTPLDVFFEPRDASMRGASGWISGIIAAWVIAPDAYGRRPSVGVSLLGLWIIHSPEILGLLFRPDSPIANAGHLFGAAGGIGYAVVLRCFAPGKPDPSPIPQRLFYKPAPRQPGWRTRVHEALLSPRSSRTSANHPLVFASRLAGRHRPIRPRR